MTTQSDFSATVPSSQQRGDQHASSKTSERRLRGYQEPEGDIHKVHGRRLGDSPFSPGRNLILPHQWLVSSSQATPPKSRVCAYQLNCS